MPFDYCRPPDLGGALAALADGDALPIAGGTSVVPLLRRREVSPRLLVGIARIPELGGIRPAAGGLSIGTVVTLAEIAGSPEVAVAAPLLSRLCASARSPQIRNAATLGGSLFSGPDFAEPALALLTLGARVRVRGRSSEREVAVEDLLAGSDGPDSLRQGELVVEIVVLPAGGARFGHYRIARREAIEPPLVACAVALQRGPDGGPEARVCLSVATPRPIHLAAVEEALRDGGISPEVARRAAEACLSEIPLRPDVRAGEGYRRRIIPTAVARAVAAALARGD